MKSHKKKVQIQKEPVEYICENIKKKTSKHYISKNEGVKKNFFF